MRALAVVIALALSAPAAAAVHVQGNRLVDGSGKGVRASTGPSKMPQPCTHAYSPLERFTPSRKGELPPMTPSPTSPRDTLRFVAAVFALGGMSSAAIATQEFVRGRSGLGASATVASVLAVVAAAWLFWLSRRVARAGILKESDSAAPADVRAILAWVAVAAALGAAGGYAVENTTGAVFFGLLSAALVVLGALTTRLR